MKGVPRDPLQTRARELTSEVDRLIAHAIELGRTLEPVIDSASPEYVASVRNLVHYLALRQADLRELQTHLAEIGLSSLGRFESCVLPTLTAVSSVLHRLAGEPVPAGTAVPAVAIAAGQELLRRHSDLLFGAPPKGRHVRIMVTMPSEAADDPALVSHLVAAGMDIARLNTAHDGPASWHRMIDHVERSRREHGRQVLIEADLAGPKLRTGPLEPGPRVQKYRPKRGPRGEVLAPLHVKLVPRRTTSPADELPLDPAIVSAAQPGDVLSLRDTRGRWRRFLVTIGPLGDPWLVVDRSVYAESSAGVLLSRGGRDIAAGLVGEIPAAQQPIRLHVGDTILLTRDQAPGQDAERDADGHVLRSAVVSCVPYEGLDKAAVGHTVSFDDGRIGGRITRIEDSSVTVEITSAASNGSNLRAAKGINLPDTDIDLPIMSEDDLAALAQLVHRVDIIGLSFVRNAADVELLQEQLARVNASDTGIVLKIETSRGFSNLPQLLLTAARSPKIGVMLARGDLAVEIGFQRLAEVQEEVLWLCEAAHVPVIWATQVLEVMARSGSPSRAEVTDAAMAERAECVMLNKGPYVVRAVSMLADVLTRMQAHQYKKRPMLRRLAVSELPKPGPGRPARALSHRSGEDRET